MDGFVDVYDVNTKIKQRVPAHWLDDPYLGRNIRKTPSQRALDGELGAAPTDDSKVDEIRAFAADAEIDLAGATKKADMLAAVREVVGTDPLPEPAAPGVAVSLGGGPTPDVDQPVGDHMTPDAADASDNSAATAGQE